MSVLAVVRAMAMERVVQTTCMRRAYSVLVWDVQTGSVAVPSDMPYLMYLLKEAIVSGCAARCAYQPGLKRDRNQYAVREIVGSCVFGYFPFVSSRGRGPCRPDGRGGAAPRGTRVRDDKIPKIMDASQTHGAIGASRSVVGGSKHALCYSWGVSVTSSCIRQL